MSRQQNDRSKKPGRRLLALMLCCILLLCGCGQEPAASTESGETASASRDIFAMDTYMTLTCYGTRAEEALTAAVAEIQRLDALLSTGSPDSEVSKLNAAGGGPVGEESAAMLEESLRVYERSGGAFDITIYPLMELWGFTGDAPAVPEAAELSACLKKVGADRIALNGSELVLGEGQAIDLGAIAKGYTSGRLMEIFEEYELTAAIVSLGGNVQCYRRKPDGSLWRCGVRDPKGEDYFGVVSVEDKAVITSGGYERCFEENGETYHHILDPKTGIPAKAGLISVTVVSENGTLADALSTACYVMGEEASAAYWREYGAEEGGAFELILMTEDGGVWITEGLQDCFTTERELHVITKNGKE